eukprot:403356658
MAYRSTYLKVCDVCFKSGCKIHSQEILSSSTKNIAKPPVRGQPFKGIHSQNPTLSKTEKGLNFQNQLQRVSQTANDDARSSYQKPLQETIQQPRGQRVSSTVPQNRNVPSYQNKLNLENIRKTDDNRIPNSIWLLTKDRGLKEFVNELEIINDQHPITPFIEAIQCFFVAITQTQEVYGSRLKVFISTQIRRELFKLFYSEDLFGIAERADAAETLMYILQLMHASQTLFFQQQIAQSVNGSELDLEQNCINKEQELCIIHDTFQIKTITQSRCLCGEESNVQKSYFNNFQYLINGSSVIQYFQGKGLQGSKSVESFLQIQGKFFEILKLQQQVYQDFCNKPDCRVKQSRTFTQIEAPYPEILTLNLNQDGRSITGLSLLRLFISLNYNELRLGDIFDNSSQQQEDSYILTGMICYSGAHYVAYFKNKEIITTSSVNHSSLQYTLNSYQRKSQSQQKWKLLNDHFVDNKASWAEVVKEAVLSNMIPTVLFYERIDKNFENYRQKVQEDMIMEKFEIRSLIDEVQQYCLEEEEQSILELNLITKKLDQKYQNNLKVPETDQNSNTSSSQSSPAKRKSNAKAYYRSQLKIIKKKYLPHNIYIHQCLNPKCNFKMLLHQERCSNCKTINKAQDYSLNVQDGITEKVIQELTSLQEEYQALLESKNVETVPQSVKLIDQSQQQAEEIKNDSKIKQETLQNNKSQQNIEQLIHQKDQITEVRQINQNDSKEKLINPQLIKEHDKIELKQDILSQNDSLTKTRNQQDQIQTDSLHKQSYSETNVSISNDKKGKIKIISRSQFKKIDQKQSIEEDFNSSTKNQQTSQNLDTKNSEQLQQPISVANLESNQLKIVQNPKDQFMQIEEQISKSQQNTQVLPHDVQQLQLIPQNINNQSKQEEDEIDIELQKDLQLIAQMELQEQKKKEEEEERIRNQYAETEWICEPCSGGKRTLNLIIYDDFASSSCHGKFQFK